MNQRRATFCVSLIVAFAAATVSAQTWTVPITKGWARNQINTVIFRKNAVTSFEGFQYTAFYDPESRVVLAKRKLASTNWEIKATQFTGNTADAHNSISIAIDGRGVLHVSWDNHNSPLRYGKTHGELHLFLQQTGQGDGESLEQIPPQMISIDVWRPDK